ISEDCESGSHEGLRNWEQPENREIESFSEHETYRNVSSDEDTEMDIEDDEMDAQVNSVDAWQTLVDQWLFLINDEDDDSRVNNPVSINSQEGVEMLYQLPVHLAVDQASKWHLSEIFTDQLD
ncbi:18144_t:CDS:1, partial [Acaulospora morrowiae]